MQTRKTFRRTALTLALALPLLAHAQANDSTTGKTTDLDNIVVTATRTAVTADASLAAVEVIDRTEIERSSAHSLPELLRGRAGISIVNQGGLGKLSTLFLRGTESDHTLVLIDGVRVGSPSSGLTALQDLPLEQIERIEIVRGPRSSLYGADAIGGVIQIFTRRGEAASGLRPHARVGIGSHALRDVSAGFDLRGTRGGFGIDAGHQSTDGINACRGIGAPLYAGCGMDNPDPDRDGYRNNNLSLHADISASDALRFDLHGLRAQGRNEYDGDPAWGLPDNSRILQQVLGGSVRYQASEALSLKFTLGRNRDDSDNYLASTFSDRFTNTRDSASLQGDITLAPGQLLSLGADWLRDRAVIDTGFDGFDASRGNRAGFVQYQGRFGAHDLQASLRRDDNDQFGGHGTGGLAWGFNVAEGWRLTASHATAFKAPSFNELYYPYFGNPALRPETSRSSELGLVRHAGNWQWQLNTYQTRIDDLIVYDTAIFAANNLDSSRLHGVELTANARLGDWSLRGQVGTLDARNLGIGANHGKRLPRRPQRSGRLDLDRDIGAFGFGISGIAEGARWDDVSNAVRVGGYATVDARMAWRIGNDLTLQANLRNAFGRTYETSAYFLQPGREFALTLRWQPK